MDFPPGHLRARRSGSHQLRSCLEGDAGEADDALGVGPLSVAAELAAGPAEDAERRVDRRVAADAAPVAVAGDGVEKRAGIPLFLGAQHHAVLALDPPQLL